MKYIIFIVPFIGFILINELGHLSFWENASICLFIYCFLSFLEGLGNKIVILDLTIIMACLTCLLMPVMFYHVYTKANPLARLWGKYMPISSDDYFSFALPAVACMALGLKMPLAKLKLNHNPGIYIDSVKKYLEDRPNLGLILLAVGVTSGLLMMLVPAGLREVFFLMGHLTFVGVFYVIYSPNKRKRLIVPGVLLLMIAQSIANGMFGELIFILACSVVLLLLGRNIGFGKKLTFALVGIFLIILIQSIKKEYRKRDWSEGADPIYFAELISDRLSSPSSMLDPQSLFVTSVRMNQGWLVATTMRMVPHKHPFGNGEPLLEAVAASVVPRIVWPDKPEAGGKANIKRFWGYTLVGWSTNLGPLGEAYANFDVIGGVIYMFFYGLFFNLVLSIILKQAERRPTLVLWIPYLFFEAIAVETDLLSTMGALVKASIFTWIAFLVFRKAFHLEL